MLNAQLLSMGAITAAGLAAAFPERVDKLVLIEGLGRGMLLKINKLVDTKST